MKRLGKIIKWFFIILGVLIGILIAIPFIFKSQLIELAKEEINKNVNAKVNFGEFDLSIFSSFPDLNFEINDVVAVGISEFEGDTLASVPHLSTEVGLLSVLGDQIKVKSVIIENPTILAKVLPGGLANWDIAVEDTAAVATEEESTEAGYKLALKEFKIINGNIIYDDKDMGIYAEIKNLNFELNGDLAMDVTALNTKTNIEEITVDMEGTKYLNKSKIELVADMEADLVNYKYTFKENTFKINELELGFDGWLAMPDTNIDMDITFEAKKTEFKNILSMVPTVYMTDFENVTTSGKLALNGFAKGTYNAVQLPAFDLTLIVEDAMFKYPDLPGSADNINIDLNVKNADGQEDNTIVDLKKFHIDFAGNPFDMRMLVTTPVSDANIDGSVKGTIDLAKLKDIVPLEDMTMEGIITSDIEMKGRMSSIDNERYEEFHAAGTIVLENLVYTSTDMPDGITIAKSEMVLSPQYIELTSFDAIMSKSDLHMNGKVENYMAYYFKDELLKGNFTFSSAFLDLNQFLSDEAETADAATTTDPEEEMTVVEIPKNIDFMLSTSIKRLLYDNLDITDISGGVGLSGGKAVMNDLILNLLDGSMKMNGNYSTEDLSKPSFDFKLNISGFDIPKTFDAFNTVQEVAPIAEKCTGKFSMAIDFNGNLQQNMEPDLASVNGTGNFQTKSIVVNNGGAFAKIGELLKSDKFNTMNLSDIDFTFKIENGNITIDPFESTYNKSKVMMGGSQSIDQTMNYYMNFDIPSSEFGGAANQVANNLFTQLGNSTGVNVSVPDKIKFNALVGGTLTEPKVTLDLKDQASNVVDDIKDQVKDRINEEVDKAKAEAIKKAEEQAAKLLAEADAKGKQLIATAEKSAATIKSEAKTAAAKVKNEGYAAADKLIKDAGNNPIKKAAAQEAAKKMRKEADNSAAKIEQEGNVKADGVINTAKKEADNLNKTAKQQGDTLIQKAKNS